MNTSNVKISENMQHVLVYEFIEVISGNMPKIDPYHFKGKSPEAQESMVLFLIQYLIEDILKWTPLIARTNLTMQVLKEWDLDKLARRVRFPPDFELETDTFYIVKKIYPNEITLNVQDVYLQTYRKVRDRKKRFPKGYFMDSSGKSKACAFLKYAIENCLSFESIDELYAFFGSGSCQSFLADNKLDIPRKVLFKTPVEYFDMLLPPSQRDPLLFNYYHLWARVDEYNHSQNERRGRPSKAAQNRTGKKKGALDLKAECVVENNNAKPDIPKVPSESEAKPKKVKRKKSKESSENEAPQT